jgi:hypothetical protein
MVRALAAFNQNHAEPGPRLHRPLEGQWPQGRHVQQGAFVPQGYAPLWRRTRVRRRERKPGPPRETADERFGGPRRISHLRAVRPAQGEGPRETAPVCAQLSLPTGSNG